MSSENLLYLFIGLVLFGFVFDKILDFVNSRNWKEEIPDSMKEYYDQEKYDRSRKYHKDKGKVSFIQSILMFIVIINVLIFGLFGKLDNYITTLFQDDFLQAVVFFGVLIVVSELISIPFSIYDTFFLEEKYGFNKMTIHTFIFDKIKGYFLMSIIGGGLLWVVLWVIGQIGEGYWYWLWIIMVAFMLLMNMFYADVILPIFNKLKPLGEGELRDEIEKYARKVGYSLKNIYVIDGSKRSTKANAFFSGLGPRKTIALYDTLIEKHSTNELVAVLAHEVGHFKKKHIRTSMILSVFQTGVILFLLEYFLSYPAVTVALGANSPSFHVGVIAFSLVFSPIGTFIGILMNVLSRKNEYEADEYAKNTFDGESLQLALKKLSVDNLSNLYPHRAYVFVHYSHPPLLSRLERLNQ